MKSLSQRLDKLESDIRRMRSAHSDPFADGVLERLTDDELRELGNLFRCHGVDGLEGLPSEALARAMELISTARQRSHPAPWPASSAPGYDVMASIREQYEASQARRCEAEHHS